MSEATRVPEVGDVWDAGATTLVTFVREAPVLTEGCCAHPEPVTRLVADVDAKDPNDIGYCRRCVAECWKFVRSASTPKERDDWARWLPPHPLPDTGPNVFKVGQVWAAHYVGVGAVVFRVKRLGDGRDNAEILAASHGGYYSGGRNTCCEPSGMGTVAVLVADVGCEPAPPEVLYGAAPASPPVVEAPPVRLAVGTTVQVSRDAPYACAGKRGVIVDSDGPVATGPRFHILHVDGDAADMRWRIETAFLSVEAPPARPAPARHWNASYLAGLSKLEAAEGVTRRAHPERCTTPRCPTCRPEPAPFVVGVTDEDCLGRDA